MFERRSLNPKTQPRDRIVRSYKVRQSQTYGQIDADTISYYEDVQHMSVFGVRLYVDDIMRKIGFMS